MAVYLDKGLEVEGILNVINNEISGRRSYGIREELIPKGQSGKVFSWSNGSACWYFGGVDRGPKSIRLDANEILVTYGIGGWPKELNRPKIWESFKEMLIDLPLYSGSTEAKVRGVFSLKDIDVPPGVIVGLVDGTLDKDSVEALRRKAFGKDFKDEWAEDMEKQLGPTLKKETKLRLLNKCSECGKVFEEFEPVRSNLNKLIGKAVCSGCVNDLAKERKAYYLERSPNAQQVDEASNSYAKYHFQNRGYKLLE